MKKFIIVASLAILAMPIASLAQINSSCGMPVNPTTAADWTSAITCLQSRISNLESRISALESRGVIGYPTKPISCEYAAPSMGCSYVKGPNYDDKTSCGLVLQCNGTTPGTPISGPTTAIPGNSTATNSSNNQAMTGSIQQGASSEAVKAIQGFLKAEGSFNYPQATGYFGSVTKNAVLQFQAAQGLTQTGMVDQATLGKIQTLAPQIAPSVVPMLQQIQTSQTKSQ